MGRRIRVGLRSGEVGGSMRLPTADPWIVLAALAAVTTRVRIGPIVTPLARRRPWKVARETVTLDQLSQGRLILPVGYGAIDDGAFCKVGEELAARVRADKVDEALEIITGLWSGQPFSYEGDHYRVDEMTFSPAPCRRLVFPSGWTPSGRGNVRCGGLRAMTGSSRR